MAISKIFDCKDYKKNPHRQQKDKIFFTTAHIRFLSANIYDTKTPRHVQNCSYRHIPCSPAVYLRSSPAVHRHRAAIGAMCDPDVRHGRRLRFGMGMEVKVVNPDYFSSVFCLMTVIFTVAMYRNFYYLCITAHKEPPLMTDLTPAIYLPSHSIFNWGFLENWKSTAPV